MNKAKKVMEAAFANDAPDPSPLEYFRMSELQNKPVPPREWLIQDWIPLHTTTLLYGDGGTGKSLLVQQLMTCCAAGKRFLNMDTLCLASVGFFCEDDAAEIHRRQNDINQHYNIDYTALDSMMCMDRVGQTNTLVQPPSQGIQSKLPLFDNLQNSVLSLGARLVIIDTAADTFCGNENDRQQVRYYIQCLNGLARSINGAVLLCAHPSLSGLTNDTGTGGSTAWSNTVRSRLYLKHFRGNDNDPANPNMRTLSRKKTNYSAIDNEGVLIEWNKGVFQRMDDPATDTVALIEKRVKEQKVKDTFLTCLDVAATQGRYVTDARNSPRHAAKIFMTLPEARGLKEHEIIKAMQALFNEKKIKIGSVMGADRHPMKAIVRVDDSAGSISAGSAESDF